MANNGSNGRSRRTRRSSENAKSTARAVMQRVANGQSNLKDALAVAKLDPTTFRRWRGIILAETAGGSEPTGPRDAQQGARQEAAETRLQAATVKVAEVRRKVAAGMKREAAIKSVGWTPSKFYYWLSNVRQASAAPSESSSSRALVPVSSTIDARGRKLVSAHLIWDSMQTLRMTAPQLEALIGCEPGTIERYMQRGMCPNEFALAINGLMAEAKLSPTGSGGYVTKQNQKVVLVRIPKGHTLILASLVDHLGGEVMHKES